MGSISLEWRWQESNRLVCHTSSKQLVAVNSSTEFDLPKDLGGQLLGGPGIEASLAKVTYLAEGINHQAYERTGRTSWTSMGGYLMGGINGIGVN
jgi:hypothetical protein